MACVAGVPEIEQRLKALALAWAELQALAAERGAKLQQSLAYQQFLAKVDEEEAWIRSDHPHSLFHISRLQISY